MKLKEEIGYGPQLGLGPHLTHMVQKAASKAVPLKRLLLYTTPSAGENQLHTHDER